MHIYICGQFIFKRTDNTTVSLGDHSRITKHYEAMSAKETVKAEINNRRGRVLIACTYILSHFVMLANMSACTTPRTSKGINRQVCSMLSEDVDLREMEFQPWSAPVGQVHSQ